MFHPVADRFPLFHKGLKECTCLGNDGGSLYLFLTERAEVVQTKHVRPFGDGLSGLKLFRNGNLDDI